MLNESTTGAPDIVFFRSGFPEVKFGSGSDRLTHQLTAETQDMGQNQLCCLKKKKVLIPDLLMCGVFAKPDFATKGKLEIY